MDRRNGIAVKKSNSLLDHNSAIKTMDYRLNKEGQTCRTQSANLIQGNMSEDEALARALALSMEDNGQNMKLTQEELDLALARQLQAAESQTTVGGSRSTRDRCHIA